MVDRTRRNILIGAGTSLILPALAFGYSNPKVVTVSSSDNLQQALLSLEPTGGVLYLNPGVWKPNGRLIYESDFPIAILGPGSGLARIQFKNATAGLTVRVNSEFHTGPMTFEGFGIHPQSDYNEDGFRLESINNQGGPRPNSHIRDVVVATRPGAFRRGGSFSNGIVVKDMPFVNIDACYTYGGSDGSGYLMLGDCTPGPTITNSRAFYWDKGVAKGSSSADKTEGTKIASCNLVNNNYGVYFKSAVGQPGMQVNGGHIASNVGGIYLENAHQSIIRGILFYRREGGSNYFDVDANNVISLNVSNTISALKKNGFSAVIRQNGGNNLSWNNLEIQGNSRDQKVYKV